MSYNSHFATPERYQEIAGLLWAFKGYRVPKAPPHPQAAKPTARWIYSRLHGIFPNIIFKIIFPFTCASNILLSAGFLTEIVYSPSLPCMV